MRIGILLPPAPDVGMLFRVCGLANSLTKILGRGADPIEVAIGLPGEIGPDWRVRERELRNSGRGVTVRNLVWQQVPVDQVRNMHPGLAPAAIPDGLAQVIVPRDWGWNFTDCNLWISLAEPGQGALIPLRPTIHYVLDLAARRVPHAFAPSAGSSFWQRQIDAFAIWRQAIVMVTDPTAIGDASSYAGVRLERIAYVADPLADYSFSFSSMAPLRRLELVWLAEASPLHDLATCLEGLSLFRSEGGELPVTILTENPDAVFALTQKDDPVVGLRTDLKPMLREIALARPFSCAAAGRILSGRTALLSSRLAGGGGNAQWLARSYGLDLLCVDQAANRDAARRFSGAPAYYRGCDSLGMADALHALVASSRTGDERTLRGDDRDQKSAPTAAVQPLENVIAQALAGIDGC